MTTVEVLAPAKINLTLHVTGRRPDGYHLLDSLVVFARNVGDRLALTLADELSLTISGPFADGVPTDERNLVLKAAKLLQTRRDVVKGCHVHLTKDLPHGGGVGGGSSDAAAALKALADMWDVEPLSADEALVLGADVPVCLRASQPTLMSGIGEKLRSTQTLPQCWLVLVNPGIVVPTAQVFERLHRHFSVENPPMEDMPAFQSFDDFELWLLGTRNDLTRCMDDFQMDVLECIWALRPLDGCSKAEMSGSGSTCWGLFRDEHLARQAALELTSTHADWWVEVAEISPS